MIVGGVALKRTVYTNKAERFFDVRPPGAVWLRVVNMFCTDRD